MSPVTETTAPPEAQHRQPRGTLRMLRVIVALHTGFVVLQPLLAGLYLTGNVDVLTWHGTINGHIIQLFGIIQLLVAICFVTIGRGRLVPLIASVLIVLAEGGQIPMGYARVLGIHIPLGVSIVAGQVLLTFWVFGRHARRGRSIREPKAERS